MTLPGCKYDNFILDCWSKYQTGRTQKWYNLPQSAEYGRTRRDLVRADPILAACTADNTIF